MALDIVHNVDRGIYRLLNAPRDVGGATKLPLESFGRDQADDKHQELFDHYKKGFQFFYPMASRWWKGCIAAESVNERTHDQAVQAAFEKRAAGPASAPEVVWFVRHIWLSCDKLNKSLPFKDRVAPEVLMLKWLTDAGEADNVTLITCMLYWPVGLDENGNWC